MHEVRLGTRILQPRRQLLADGERVPIGRRALDVLSMLADANGLIVTKDELLEGVWPGVSVEENALQVHIVALRKALGADADRLTTIRGVGYQLDIGDNGISAHTSASSDVIGAGVLPEPPTAAVQEHPYSWLRWKSLNLFIVAALLLTAAAWSILRNGPLFGPQERIPVLVRGFASSGSGGRAEAALASGITGELVNRLRRVPALRIGTGDSDGRNAGAAFRYAYTVGGNIRGSGDRLRVTARLTNKAGEVLWSQAFYCRLVDLLEVQEAIAGSISDTLDVLLDAGRNPASFGGTDKPAAHAAYLRYKSHEFDADQTIPARHLERALAIDPDYIEALSAMSTLYGIQSNRASTKAQAMALLAKMDAISARAEAANPRLWIGHAARGNYYDQRRYYAAAALSFRRVAQLDHAVNPELRDALAAHALLNGRAREALSLLDSNAAIDPAARHEPRRIWALVDLGRYRDAIELFESRTARDPASVEQYASYVAQAYLMLGEEAEAIAFARRHKLPMESLAEFKANPSLLKMALPELKQWATKRFGEAGRIDLVGLAQLASHYGQPKLAIELLRLDFEKPGGFALGALWLPAMANARKSPDFEPLMTQLGLTEYWRESGRWPDHCRKSSPAAIRCS